MEANKYLAVAMILTGTVILTMWFAKGYLNTFVKNSFIFVALTIEVMFKLFNRFLIAPLSKLKLKKIHIPLGIKIVLYIVIGIGILVLDHFYGTTIYEADETTFYHFFFQETTYWITKEALVIGGFFIVIGVFLLLMEILECINKILSTPIHISIIIKK